MTVLKVSSTSQPASVAGAIANALKTENKIEVTAIGAGAVNQAVKAIAIARGYVAPTGINLVCIPGFCDTKIDEQEKSSIKFVIKSEN
jgi:stage V sporulation protein S